jgi:MarR family transcriptional regulator, 2-MHQ and catechol-resistance regulon repressor
MGIQKDIHQNQFRNGHNKAMVNLLFTHSWLIEKIKLFVKLQEITPQQYNILRILRGASEPLSTLQIRHRMLDKMSDTSRIVDRLLVKGLVTKNTSQKDKRLVEISISAMGKKTLADLDARNSELDNIMGNLTDAESETLSLLLDRLRDSQ